MTPPRGDKIQDPLLMQAFAEGVQQGMASIYSGDEPSWEVTISFDGTPLNQFTSTRLGEILKRVEEALTNGCSVSVVVGAPAAQSTEPPPALVLPNDDEIVDAEVVD